MKMKRENAAPGEIVQPRWYLNKFGVWRKYYPKKTPARAAASRRTESQITWHEPAFDGKKFAGDWKKSAVR
jgi:hypothetical protein